MRIHQGRGGFTLVELTIVVAIIAIIASMGVPKLLSARANANEAAAVATLRTLCTAEAQIQSSAAIDTNGDGNGEFAYFGELAGTKPLRVFVGGAAGMGTAGIDELSPSILSALFGAIDASGRLTRSGYHFALYLPSIGPGGAAPGLAEAALGGADAGSLPDAEKGATYWCCYAWPVDHEGTGTRAFFVDAQGSILQCSNRTATPFDGAANVPTFDECYTQMGDMSSPMVNGAPSLISGQLWTPLHN